MCVVYILAHGGFVILSGRIVISGMPLLLKRDKDRREILHRYREPANNGLIDAGILGCAMFERPIDVLPCPCISRRTRATNQQVGAGTGKAVKYRIICCAYRTLKIGLRRLAGLCPNQIPRCIDQIKRLQALFSPGRTAQ